MELSTEFYLIDVSFSLSFFLCRSSAEITRKQRAGGRMEKYVGDQISSNAARLLARVYLSDGDRTSENRMKGNGCARITSLRTRSNPMRLKLSSYFFVAGKKVFFRRSNRVHTIRGDRFAANIYRQIYPLLPQPSIKHSKNKFPLD